MSGSVQRTPSGRYRVRVYIGDGKTKSITFDAPNMRAARKLANEPASLIVAGKQDRDAGRGTVTELVDQWLTFQQGEDRSPATLYRLNSITRVIKEHLGGIQRRELTAHQINQFHATLRKTVVARATDTQPARPMSESTVHHYYRVLRSILNYGEQHDLVDVVATRKAAKPKPVEHEIVLPDDAEMAALFVLAPHKIKLVIRIDALLGLRRGELVGLRWSDLRNGVVYVRNNTIEIPAVVKGDGPQLIDKTPKSRKPRAVPMPLELELDLADLRAEMEASAEQAGVKLAGDARVLADMLEDPTGRKPVSPSWISGTWRRHCETQGVHVRLHDLRHWYVTNGLAAGIPIRDMMGYSGHAQITTTQRYAHLAESAHELARTAMSGKAGLFALPPVSS